MSALVGLAYWVAAARSESGVGSPEAPRDILARADSEPRAGSRSGRRKPMTDGAQARAECWFRENAVWGLPLPRRCHRFGLPAGEACGDSVAIEARFERFDR